MKVVICGGGIIGSSCAYYLAKRNIACVIVEQEEVACGASGKAGGFLARNWCESNNCDELARFSYNLHMELIKELNDVGYRCVNTYSGFIDSFNVDKTRRDSNFLTWVDGPLKKQARLETDKDTAQVHPKKLCQRLLHEARKMTDYRTKVVFDKVVGIEFDHTSSVPTVKAVKLEAGESIEADKVIIAMGPWSRNAAAWFPDGTVPPIRGHRAHSIVLKAPAFFEGLSDCLFLQYRNGRGTSCPELYPRPDGTVYISGMGDEYDMPEKASQVEIERWRCSQLREIAYATSTYLESAEMLAEQACLLPLSPDGVPVIGLIGQVEGAYIACGHSCWGILNSTGTGYVMAELIVTGECLSVDLKPFDPDRFK